MTESQNRFQQAMNQGHTAAWDQDWQRAVDYYHQALEEIPDDPIALVSLGLALYELGLYDQAHIRKGFSTLRAAWPIR